MSEHKPIKTAEDWIEYIKSYKRRNGSKLPVAIAVPTKDFLALVNDFKQVCDSNNKRRAKAASTNKITERDRKMSEKEKTPRYQAFSIDGHICRPCCGDSLEELNRNIKHYPKGSKRQPYFVRDNVKEKWI